MGKENIEKYDFFYLLLKKYADFWHNNIFYRKVIAYGKDHLDFSVPTILAPNHQNALMDALAIICTLDRQLVFLARADIFRKKLVASILYRLKILPVYRLRDGYENLKQNDDTFHDTLRVMEHRNGVVILPEGSHDVHRKLRQLKKGICRIAFQTAEASDYKKEINIVPVGIEYSHYWSFRQVLTVVYGHPIHVSEYFDSYRQNPNRAIVELRDRLSSDMKKVMVHIEEEQDYEAINELRSIINEKYSDRIKYPKLFRDNRLICKVNELHQKDPDAYARLCSDSLTVRDLAKELKLTYRHLIKKKHPLVWLLLSWLFLFVTLPVFVVGVLLNFIIFKVSEIQSLKTKDPGFISTTRYGFLIGLGLIMAPVYLIAALILIKPWWLAIAAFLLVPVLGILAWNWSLLFKRTVGGFRIRRLLRTNNSVFIRLRNTYSDLIKTVSGL